MANYDVEKGFLSKLLETKDLMTIKDSQIKTSYFSGENKLAFKFIYDTAMSTGEVPTVRAFKKRFPAYKLEQYTKDGEDIVGTEENLIYWCQELRTKVKHNKIAEVIEDSMKDLQGFKSEEAYAKIKQGIAYIESEVVETSDVDITKNTEERKQAYLKRKENKGMLGLSYGIPALDFMTKGIKKETLTTIIANTGVGKTWFEIFIGAYSQLQSCRVLQFVTEMSEEIMRDRYEAMLFSMCYGELNYNQFKSGMLSLQQEKAYFEFLENDLPHFEPLIISTATGVMGVSAEIEKYKPDLVLIDGVYLMEDDQGADSDWLRVAHITRDLKKLAKRAKTRIVINTQADKNTSKKTGPELGSISYTQAIGQDSDDVFALYRDEIMFNDKEMCIKVLKQREGTLGKVMLNWNFDVMDFSEIYSESSNSQEEMSSSSESVQADNTLDIL